MRRSKLRLILDTALVGVAVTAIVLVFQLNGWLSRLDVIAYDVRARHAQSNSPRPTDQLVHIDIDDAALEEIGRWPWDRDKMARILDELRLAQPKVIGLDIFFSEPQPPRFEPQVDGPPLTINPDQLLADAVGYCGNVLVPMHVSLDTPPPSSLLQDWLIKALTRDLEPSPDELVTKAAADMGIEPSVIKAQFTHEYPFALKEAVFRRVDEELGMGENCYSVTSEDLREKLLPGSHASGVRTNADHALEQVLPRVQALRAMERLTCVPPDGLSSVLSSDQGEATIPLL